MHAPPALNRLVLLALCAAAHLVLKAQPQAEWSIGYGGEGFEEMWDLVVLPDSGFVAMGWSGSPASGRIQGVQQGSGDVLALRGDKDGNVLWETRIGGTEADAGFSLVYDGADQLFLIGETRSDSDGNKLSPRVGPGPWVTDVFIVSLDLAGNYLWDRSFGGEANDWAVDGIFADNGNLFVLGNTESMSDGATDRVQPLQGSADYWLLEVTPDGDLLREHVYGGVDYDRAWRMISLTNGNLLLAGASQSDVNGDKTIATFGSSDAWLLEVSLDGAIQNQYQYGGSEQETPFVLAQYSNGDVIVGSNSLSAAGTGNKTSGAFGDLDFWAVRFALGSGAIQWQNTYGGSAFDSGLGGLVVRNDHVLISGITRSADRTTSSSSIMGADDAWFFYLSDDGEVIYDITRGGDGNENLHNVRRSLDGGFFAVGISSSESFDWKDEQAYGLVDGNGVRPNDGWIVKLVCDFEVDLGPSDLRVCTGTTVDLDSGLDQINANTTFEWSTGEASEAISFAAANDVEVRLIAINASGCESRDSINITVGNAAEVIDLQIDSIGCEGTPGAVSVTLDDATAPFRFEGMDYVGEATVPISEPGDYTIILDLDGSGCGEDVNFSIAERQPFAVDLGPNRDEAFGSTIVLTTPFSAEQGFEITWTGVLNGCTACDTTTFTFTENTLVEVTVRDTEGCTAVDAVRITGNRNRIVGIPSAFSPNGDGTNERFGVFPTSFVERLGPLEIYDRWGGRVYVGLDEQILVPNGWDGTFAGEDVLPGVYTYILPVRYADGVEIVFQGTVTLVR